VVQVHVYETWNFSGEAQESEEMRPAWFPEDQIPFDQMWADDQHWLPLLLEGKRFLGRSVCRHHSLVRSLRFALTICRFDYSDEDTIDDFSVRIQ
jgi:hypothetical protein